MEYNTKLKKDIVNIVCRNSIKYLILNVMPQANAPFICDETINP